MNRGVTLVLLCLLAAGSFFAGWVLRAPARGSSPTHTPPKRERAAESARLAEAAAREKKIASELSKKEEQLAALARENETLKKRLSASSAKVPAAPAEGKDARGPRFRYQGLETALDAVDWRASADAAVAMLPAMKQIADAISKGKALTSLDPGVLAGISQHNGVLVKQALTLMKDGVSGTGANGAFTHPAAMVNLIVATLASANHPLDDAQLQSVDEIGQRYLDEDSRRLALYDDSTPKLKEVIDETDLKDRFFADVDAVLDDAQRTVLHPAGTRGRVQLDLFSSGLVWATCARPLLFGTKDQLATQLASQLSALYGVSGDNATAFQNLVSQALNAYPDRFLSAPSSALDRNGMVATGRVETAARQQLALEETVLTQLPWTPEEAKKIRGQTLVLVPVRKAPETPPRK